MSLRERYDPTALKAFTLFMLLRGAGYDHGALEAGFIEPDGFGINITHRGRTFLIHCGRHDGTDAMGKRWRQLLSDFSNEKVAPAEFNQLMDEAAKNEEVHALFKSLQDQGFPIDRRDPDWAPAGSARPRDLAPS